MLPKTFKSFGCCLWAYLMQVIRVTHCSHLFKYLRFYYVICCIDIRSITAQIVGFIVLILYYFLISLRFCFPIPHDVLLDLVCLYDCQHLFPMMYYSTLYACRTVNTYSLWCITRPCMFVRLSTLIPHDVLLDLVCL